MKTSQQGIQAIKDFEGCRLTAYLCPAGVPTIGYGFTSGVKLGDTMTQKQCDERLARELMAYEVSVMRATGGLIKQSEFDALVSFSWNVGIAGMKNSSVVKAHNRGDKTGAARAFGLWNKAGGKVLPGLTRRRSAEAAMYLSDSAGQVMAQAVDAPKPLTSSTTMIAGGTAAIATATQVLDSVSKFKSGVADVGDWFLPALAIVALIAIGWVLYERYQNRKRGAI